MKRRLALLSALLLTGSWVYPETQLPEPEDYQSFEVEPPILIPNRDAEPEKATAEPRRSMRDPAELEKQVERAKRAAVDAQVLFKRGILSKVEVELRELRIVRLQSDLANARVERAKAELVIQQTRYEMGEIPKDGLAEATRQLQAVIEAADAAAAAKDHAEIAAAEANLRRQQKLVELGSARRSDVARAEQKLAELKAGKN